jgi:O-antigen/teichoic acid export membrane protein
MLQIQRKIHLTRGMADLLTTFVSHGGGMLVGLAMQSLLAWALGAEGRGEYAVCLIISSFIAVISTIGADRSVSYYISTNKYPPNRIISFTVLYFCLAACMVLWLFPLVMQIKIDFFAKVSEKALNSAVLWAVSMVALSFCYSILSGMREFNFLAKLTLSKSSVTLLMAFAILKTTNLGIRAPIIADTISCFGGAIIVFLFLVNKFNYRWEWPYLPLIQKIIHYALRAFISTIGMIANARIGTILLAFYVNNRSLGFFALSMSFLSQLLSISDVTAKIIQPRIAASQMGRCDLVNLCARWIGILVLSIGVMLVILAHTWIPILFSTEFLPISEIIIILLPGIWLRAVAKVLYPFFNGINRPEIVSISMAINFISNLLILIAVIEPYGLKGAAWATTISYSLSTLYVIRKYIIITRCALWEIFVVRKKDSNLLIDQFLRIKA